jgi:hypothetical protein
MPLKSEVAERVAATPPSQRVAATPRRRSQPPNQTVRLFFSRDEGVAPTFCDEASQLPVATTASFRLKMEQGVNTPWRISNGAVYSQSVKHHKFFHAHNPMPADVTQPPAADLSRNAIDIKPLSDEVARRAYFSYVNQGSLPGHDVRDWLEAEAQLLAESTSTPNPNPQKGENLVSESRTTQIQSASPGENRGWGRMGTTHDPQKLFRICALL